MSRRLPEVHRLKIAYVRADHLLATEKRKPMSSTDPYGQPGVPAAPESSLAWPGQPPASVPWVPDQQQWANPTAPDTRSGYAPGTVPYGAGDLGPAWPAAAAGPQAGYVAPNPYAGPSYGTPPPGAYAASPFGAPAYALGLGKAPRNGWAIASFVVSLLMLVVGVLSGFYFGSVLVLLMANQGLQTAKRLQAVGYDPVGRNLARWGMGIGVLNLLIVVTLKIAAV